MKITGRDILDKFTTRNYMAITFTSVFLYAVVVTVHGEAGIQMVHSMVKEMTVTEALAIGTIGGGIGGVFFKMVSDMVQFYFRTNPKKKEPETTP